MSTLRTLRGAAAAAALVASVAPVAAGAQTTSGSDCSWSADVSSTLASCANWTITRTLGGGFSNFTVELTNTTPAGRGPQIFRTIFAYVPAGTTEANVSNFTSAPAGYTLAGGPFNGTIFSDGVARGNAQSIIDWTSDPGTALGIGQTGTYTFRIQGDVNITELGVHAQRVGANDQSQWVVFGGGVNVVPEPSTYALMATGLAGLVVFGRRRRNA